MAEFTQNAPVRFTVKNKMMHALFVDYVRMVRGKKDVDWSKHLTPEDLVWIHTRVDLDGWYPMDTFERLGVAILHEVARGQLEGVRMWGRFQVPPVQKQVPMLVAESNPRETMMRFGVLASSFFDFGALGVGEVVDDAATAWIAYGMSRTAEETASYQTLGFLEGLLEAAGATDVSASFTARAWDGAPKTLVALHWTPPG